jgi:outer membrane receptor for ferric coprogen and ferric-rhodotorulic acid
LRAQTATPGAHVLFCDAQAPSCVNGALATMRPYAVLDLRAAYQLNRNWQVALSVNNVFDKRYFLSQSTPELSVWYGDPSNFMLRVDAKF